MRSTRRAWLLALLAPGIAPGACSDYCLTPTSCVQAGFCTDVAHIDTRDAQPDEQLERWELPTVNATHLVIRWAPSAALCSQTIDEYVVSLNSSSRIFNMVLAAFGTFPQNACAAESPARAAATLGDGRRAVSPCGSYERRCTRTVTETIVEMKPYQWSAFGWAPNNLTVQAAAYGALRQPFGAGRRVPLWCISFRKYNPRMGAPTGRGPAANSLAAAWARAVRWASDAARGLREAPTCALSLFVPLSS
ncbi:hypothetical protein KFE25_000514 [Diacronema lutheri]|uniref:Uncharacterized protein n=1 Tax=Diacronema lutheri TaxID=2081491 RepID=A0A8J6CGZ2_DIALT|nr:hypothetical protein KFE25_000514 [Diacronema lutheri]